MKSIKWTGGIQYHEIGALTTGRIITETEVSISVMTAWVAQGFAEWIKEQETPVPKVKKEVKHGRH